MNIMKPAGHVATAAPVMGLCALTSDQPLSQCLVGIEQTVISILFIAHFIFKERISLKSES